MAQTLAKITALPLARHLARPLARPLEGGSPLLTGGALLLLESDSLAACRALRQLARIGLDDQVVHQERLLQALELPELAALSLALVNLQLDDAAGLDVVHRLNSAAPEVPIVVLSERPELAEQALLVGAQEVLRPDADESTLRGALRRAMLRKQADRHVRYLASHDALTGLSNTALFHERLSQCIARVQRDNAACAVFYLDLDGFKPINDSLGHAAGDHLLRMIAGRLGEAIRSCDTAARLGGDEFALLLEDVCDREAVQRVARRVLRSLSAPVSLKNGLDVRITSSIGVALCPQSGQTAESVLHAADTAMFAAKKAGKSQYRFAGDARAPDTRLWAIAPLATDDRARINRFQPSLIGNTLEVAAEDDRVPERRHGRGAS